MIQGKLLSGSFMSHLMELVDELVDDVQMWETTPMQIECTMATVVKTLLRLRNRSAM